MSQGFFMYTVPNYTACCNYHINFTNSKTIIASAICSTVTYTAQNVLENGQIRLDAIVKENVARVEHLQR